MNFILSFTDLIINNERSDPPELVIPWINPVRRIKPFLIFPLTNKLFFFFFSDKKRTTKITI